MICPNCQSLDIEFFHQDKRRSYFHCLQCELVFVDPTQLPPLTTEEREYSLHNNSDSDDGYLRFLDRARLPLLKHIPLNAYGIDFGSGPNPVLARRLINDGYRVDVYDPIFAPNKHWLERSKTYDFIVSTEAIEHFHKPHKEWQLWLRLLRPNGHLIIMTKRWLSKARFSTWHYKNDPTHVSFFSLRTFEYLAQRDGLTIKFTSDDVVVMQRIATQDIITD
ncbi:class I SAM-dependent methyltransferase [Alteromonas flava]|uniref:class I SAM-dependent methyltransferase n=1 Tax=Alteromonas flava TaxID=2048003 RepID=UPI000C282177|nr:class I SAM-dependent methyltransferase [Alteromonas flava]